MSYGGYGSAADDAMERGRALILDGETLAVASGSELEMTEALFTA